MPGLIGIPGFAVVRGALAAVAVAASFAAASAEVPPGFVARPDTLPKTFPSVGAFRKVPGRRLQAEGGKPARELYVAEEGGHRLLYEYASNSTAEQILHADREESLVALSCDVPRQAGGTGLLRLLWRAAAGAASWARPPLQPGHAVVGGPAWGCGRVPGEGFAFEVVEIKQAASVAEPTTVVLVRPKHPLHFFPDLFLGLTWTGVGERRLSGDSSWNFTPPAFGYNIDDDGNPYMRNIDIGPLRCFDCTASLQPTISFTLRTTGAVPTAASVRISGFLNISLSAGLTNAAVGALEDSWKRIQEYFGPELISIAASAGAGAAGGGAGGVVLLPLFNQVTDALDIELRPVVGFDTMLKSLRDILMDGRINVGITTDPANTYFELSWSQEEGMQVDASTDFDASFQFDGTAISSDVMAGIRSCLGLQLNVLNARQPFTSLEVCPEMKAFARNSSADTSAVLQYPAEIASTSATPDARLCFQFESLTTDVDLDVFLDEPYLEGCFLGKCVTSGIGSFSGETAHFPAGQNCIDIQRSDLEVADICLHAHESDPLYNQQYAEPHYLRLTSSTCPNLDCELNEVLVPKGGSEAQMRVGVVVSNLRRLQSTQSASRCYGTALGVSMGVSGSFSGFHYPSFFNRGSDDEAVHPGGRMPARRPQQPYLLCEELRHATASLACRSAMVLRTVPAVFAALIWTGRQVLMA